MFTYLLKPIAIISCLLGSLFMVTSALASTGTLILDNKTSTHFMLLSYHGLGIYAYGSKPSPGAHKERLAAGAKKTIPIDLSPDLDAAQGSMRLLLYVEGKFTLALALKLVADGENIRIANSKHSDNYKLKEIRYALPNNTTDYDRKRIHLVILNAAE